MTSERWERYKDLVKERMARRFRHHVRTEKNPGGRIHRETSCALWRIKGMTHNGKIEAHHISYDKPFVVAWLCVACHRRVEHGTFRLLQKHICDYTSLVIQRLGAQKNDDEPRPSKTTKGNPSVDFFANLADNSDATAEDVEKHESGEGEDCVNDGQQVRNASDACSIESLVSLSTVSIPAHFAVSVAKAKDERSVVPMFLEQ